MVTPFDDAGALDLDAAARLARWLSEHGSDGLVVSGTTGEAPVLSDDEMQQLWRSVREAVTIPVLAGTGTNDTRHSVELTMAAEKAGVDGVLVVTPYYSRPSQQGMAAHFEAIARSTSLPVLLYDIPVRAGRRIALDTMLHLARDVQNIVGVKDATGDVASSARLAMQAPAGFEIYSGDDALTLALLAVGAVGVVSVASNWAPAEMSDVICSFAKGDLTAARKANARLMQSYEFESSESFPNPLPAKAACRALGLRVGQCRMPFGEAPPELDQRAVEVLRGLGLPEGSARERSAGGTLA